MSDPDHILVVEDEPITREQLVSYFEEEGFRVSSTGSGDEVQNILDDSDVILVLLDIKLPGKDGLTLTREIRANNDVGIILVTSKQEQIDRILGLESGADDYVTKPFDPRETAQSRTQPDSPGADPAESAQAQPSAPLRRLEPRPQQTRTHLSRRRTRAAVGGRVPTAACFPWSKPVR